MSANRAGNVPVFQRRGRYRRFLRVAFAPCLPSAVRVFFGKCEIVRFFFATFAAFFIFFRAVERCFRDAIEFPCFADNA